MERFRLRAMCLCAAAVLLLAVFGNGCGSGEDVAKGEQVDTETAAALERVELDALQSYQWYLEREIFELLQVAQRLSNEIVRGNASEMNFLYQRSRVLYGHLAPAALLFPSLEKRINGYEEDFSKGEEFSGFHGIERTVVQKSEGAEQLANQLIGDLRRFRQAIEGGELEPQPIAEAAGDLMKEVSDRWPPGKVQPYAHHDLVDISAQVEGAQRAYEAVRPLLLISHLDLAADVELKLVYCYEILAGRGTPARGIPTPEPNAGALFIPYGDMNELDIEEISEPLDELTEALLKVPQRLTP
jgi:iron uptake system component EfeO